MTIVKDYLDLTEKWKNEYGERTLLLMHVFPPIHSNTSQKRVSF